MFPSVRRVFASVGGQVGRRLHYHLRLPLMCGEDERWSREGKALSDQYTASMWSERRVTVALHCLSLNSYLISSVIVMAPLGPADHQSAVRASLAQNLAIMAHRHQSRVTNKERTTCYLSLASPTQRRLDTRTTATTQMKVSNWTWLNSYKALTV